MKKIWIPVIVLAFVILAGVFYFLGKNEGEKNSVNNAEGQISNTANSTDTVTYTPQPILEKKTPVKVTYKLSNSWENNGKKCAQINVKIESKDEPINKWKLGVQVPEDAKLEQSWSGKYTMKKGALYISPVDYNAEIRTNSSVDLGFIIASKSAFSFGKSIIEVNGVKYNFSGDEGPKADANKQLVSATPSAQPVDDLLATVEPIGEAGEENKASEEKETKEVKEENKKEKNVFEKNPWKLHGKLKVKGTKIVDKKGKSFVLRGVSTHGIAWFPEYVNKQAFKTLRDKYNVNMIRIAMYSNESDGYTVSLHKTVKKAVKQASKLGMYVIVDWHILNDNNPNTKENIKKASAFFKEMTASLKKYDNVIYEICNEPNGDVAWERDIKPYAKRMIKIIRKNKKDAIIIVGTPTWSQDVDVVAQSPLKGEKNIMYALHFYASTHKDDLRDKVERALDAKLPIFVSEFSICEASGNGSIDKASAKAWFKLIKANKLSTAAWSLCNKDESAALIKPSCKKTSGWKTSDLSETGKWILGQYKKGK